VLTRSPASLDVGRVTVGAMPTLNVMLANHSPVPIRVVAVTSDNSAIIPAPTCVGTLMPGQNCTFATSFTPQTTGKVKGRLGIVDNGAGSPQIVTVAGMGIAATSLH